MGRWAHQRLWRCRRRQARQERQYLDNPATLGSDRLAAYATHKVDLQLRKYGAVIADPSNPVEVLEMVTNDPGAAAFFEERMRALEVPGYVRLVPKRP